MLCHKLGVIAILWFSIFGANVTGQLDTLRKLGASLSSNEALSSEVQPDVPPEPIHAPVTPAKMETIDPPAPPRTYTNNVLPPAPPKTNVMPSAPPKTNLQSNSAILKTGPSPTIRRLTANSFEMTITKLTSSEMVGANCHSVNGQLQVDEIVPGGAINRANLASTDETIQLKDMIVEVNGQKDVDKMLDEIMEKSSFTLKISRPFETVTDAAAVTNQQISVKLEELRTQLKQLGEAKAAERVALSNTYETNIQPLNRMFKHYRRKVEKKSPQRLDL